MSKNEIKKDSVEKTKEKKKKFNHTYKKIGLS